MDDARHFESPSKMGRINSMASQSNHNILSGMQGAGPSQGKLNEYNSTLDLMYSYDPPKVAFSEDTVKRMNLKIK
jgi:hypothetical protein